jgi:ParB family chromosome partitioning protein
MASKGRTLGLGRGLSALLGDDASGSSKGGGAKAAQFIPIEHITPNPNQPRQNFDMVSLRELADSLGEHGVLQPVLVRPYSGKSKDDAKYELIAGERRWRAAQMAGIHEVPVVIKDLTDKETLEISIIENVQREDLSPVEEASSYKRLADEFGHTQEQVSKLVGKSRSHVTNLMRLLNLPNEVLDLIDNRSLSMGHARALVGRSDAVRLAKEITQKGFSVRQAEAMVASGGIQSKTQGGKNTPSGKSGKIKAKDADTKALENDMSAALGLKVSIDYNQKTEEGSITISYKSLEQLDDVLEKLAR